MAVHVKIRQWGNSIGIVIPTDVAERLRLRADEEVVVEIQKKENVLKELWGEFRFKKPTKQLIREARRDLESKWER